VGAVKAKMPLLAGKNQSGTRFLSWVAAQRPPMPATVAAKFDSIAMHLVFSAVVAT